MSWSAGPRYLLRRCCVMRMISNVKLGRVLEIGCGAGDMARCLAGRGCQVVGVESSVAARQEALARTEPVRDLVTITEDLSGVTGRFDVVAAFEVLEHIEDDAAALRDWSDRVVPGGLLLISVPAHHCRWGPSDVWAGHFRRYERQELRERLNCAGLEVETIWSYGFPLANLAEPIREWLAARRLKREGEMPVRARTARSGVDRRLFEKALNLAVHGPLILPFHWMQVPFLHKDCGNGYLALARRPADKPGSST